ncbi:hypothetical protein MMPV_008409 [Pyropia vietnamensis]
MSVLGLLPRPASAAATAATGVSPSTATRSPARRRRGNAAGRHASAAAATTTTAAAAAAAAAAANRHARAARHARVRETPAPVMQATASPSEPKAARVDAADLAAAAAGLLRPASAVVPPPRHRVVVKMTPRAPSTSARHRVARGPSAPVSTAEVAAAVAARRERRAAAAAAEAATRPQQPRATRHPSSRWTAAIDQPRCIKSPVSTPGHLAAQQKPPLCPSRTSSVSSSGTTGSVGVTYGGPPSPTTVADMFDPLSETGSFYSRGRLPKAKVFVLRRRGGDVDDVGSPGSPISSPLPVGCPDGCGSGGGRAPTTVPDAFAEEAHHPRRHDDGVADVTEVVSGRSDHSTHSVRSARSVRSDFQLDATPWASRLASDKAGDGGSGVSGWAAASTAAIASPSAVPPWAGCDPWAATPVETVARPGATGSSPTIAVCDDDDDTLAEWPSYTQSAMGGCWGGAGAKADHRGSDDGAAVVASPSSDPPPESAVPAFVPPRHRRQGRSGAPPVGGLDGSTWEPIPSNAPFSAKKQYRGRFIHRLLRRRSWPSVVAASATAAAGVVAADEARLPQRSSSMTASATGASADRHVSLCADEFVSFVTAGATTAAESGAAVAVGRQPLRWLARVGARRRRQAAAAAVGQG